MNADQATFLAQYFATLMEQEFASTCKVIEAVPEAQREYKPDEKSRTAWELVTHLAISDVWFLDSIMAGSFVFDPSGEEKQRAQFGSVADVSAFYAKEFPARLQQLRGLPADELTRVVDFFGMIQAPAARFLGLANNHGIHHRGQLASYLRAMGAKVPAIYGASADEPFVQPA